MKRNHFSFLLAIALLFSIGLACGKDEEEPKQKSESKVQKLETYTIKGLTFSYYRVPAGQSREELIATAQEIHNNEPNAQLVLVDDDSQLKDYVNYVQEVSKGNTDVKLPKEWADKHIIANVQKYMSGKWMLLQGYGYKEIAALK